MAGLISALARCRDEDTLSVSWLLLPPALIPGSAWVFWIKESTSDDFRAARWSGLRQRRASGCQLHPAASVPDVEAKPVIISGPLPGTATGELTLVQPVVVEGRPGGPAHRRGASRRIFDPSNRGLLRSLAEEVSSRPGTGAGNRRAAQPAPGDGAGQPGRGRGRRKGRRSWRGSGRADAGARRRSPAQQRPYRVGRWRPARDRDGLIRSADRLCPRPPAAGGNAHRRCPARRAHPARTDHRVAGPRTCSASRPGSARPPWCRCAAPASTVRSRSVGGTRAPFPAGETMLLELLAERLVAALCRRDQRRARRRR